jgi:hypothetical protein
MKIDNELTDLIKKTLSEHEESYVEGAWENFIYQQKRRRRVLYWRISSSVAACLLLGLLFISIPGGDPARQKGTPAQITAENTTERKEDISQIKESTQKSAGYNATGMVNISENAGDVDNSKNSVKNKKKTPQTVSEKSSRELIAENMPEKMVTENPAVTDKEKEAAAIQKSEPSEKGVAIQEKEKQEYTFDIRESDDVRGKTLRKKGVIRI